MDVDHLEDERLVSNGEIHAAKKSFLHLSNGPNYTTQNSSPVGKLASDLDSFRPIPFTTPLSSIAIASLENSAAKFILLLKSASDPDQPAEIRKLHLETAIRTVFWNELRRENSFSVTEWIIRFAISCVEAEAVEPGLPYILFHEGCEWGSCEEKEQVANMFVDLRDKWRNPKFALCRNSLIRLSTELLAELSRTSSARVRGRLLSYVGARIPISDKSAANFLGEFNTGKTPTTNGLTTGSANNLHENTQFQNVCNLLDYLRNPQLIISEGHFDKFKTVLESVVDAMTPSDMKEAEEGELDDGGKLKILPKSAVKESKLSPTSSVKFHRFVPDTEQGALTQDLKDDQVKRNVLSRALIAIQYIILPSKPKGVFEANVEQLAWCDLIAQNCLAILSRTNPKGPLFVERLVDHLDSEANMSSWKDASCPPLELKPRVDLSQVPTSPQDFLPYPKVKRINKAGREITTTRKSIKDLPVSGRQKYCGSLEYTRLLSKGPTTNEEYQQLDFQPPPLDIFAPVVSQKVLEEPIKLVNDEKYQWRALRILGKRTHIHFSSNDSEKAPTKDISGFLENYIHGLADTIPALQNAREQAIQEAALLRAQLDALSAMNVEETPETTTQNNDAASGQVDEEFTEPQSPEPVENNENQMDVDVQKEADPAANDKEYIRRVATQISPDWEKFSKHLGFEPDEISYWKDSFSDPLEATSQMLQVWVEKQSDATSAMTRLLDLLKEHYT